MDTQECYLYNMRREISHDLPHLVTSGNRILRSDTMQAISLRGVNRSGLEYTEPSDGGFLAAAALTEVWPTIGSFSANPFFRPLLTYYRQLLWPAALRWSSARRHAASIPQSRPRVMDRRRSRRGRR